MGLRFAVGLFLLLGFFQGLELGLAENQILLSGFGFKRFQALGKGLQVMAQPNLALVSATLASRSYLPGGPGSFRG
jgi:hypothetical protein